MGAVALELAGVATGLDGGLEGVEAHAGFAARFGRGALQQLADAREQALLAADPADAQLLYGFDRGGGGGILIELRQNFAEEASRAPGE